MIFVAFAAAVAVVAFAAAVAVAVVAVTVAVAGPFVASSDNDLVDNAVFDTSVVNAVGDVCVVFDTLLVAWENRRKFFYSRSFIFYFNCANCVSQSYMVIFVILIFSKTHLLVNLHFNLGVFIAV